MLLLGEEDLLSITACANLVHYIFGELMTYQKHVKYVISKYSLLVLVLFTYLFWWRTYFFGGGLSLGAFSKGKGRGLGAALVPTSIESKRGFMVLYD